jgi:hypothetical protein
MVPGNERFWSRMHGLPAGSAYAWGEDRSGVAFWRERGEGEGRAPGRFFIMGHGQGFVPFLDTHIVLGMLGPLIHPAPERVLTIGVGSGGTPYGATVNPATREIRAIELIRPVLDVLDEIARERPESGVAALIADRRVSLEYGDGRRALTRGEGLYDVIEADAYQAFIKPFRLVEDVYNTAGTQIGLLTLGRIHGWPQELLEDLIGLIIQAHAISQTPMSRPADVLLMSAYFRASSALWDRLGAAWDLVPEAERAAWSPQTGTLGVAARARETRRQQAWASFQVA